MRASCFIALAAVITLPLLGCGRPVPLAAVETHAHYMSKEDAVRIQIKESGMNSALYVGRWSKSRSKGVVEIRLYYYLNTSSNLPVRHVHEVWIRLHSNDNEIVLADGNEKRVVWTREFSPESERGKTKVQSKNDLLWMRTDD